MKPILINLNDMSDSKEVYDSKPNFFLTGFIYLLLGILIIALTWMYFGRIDVVVKSEGIIRPNNQVATVVNTYGGTLESVNIEDGSYVQEEDILYTIEHEDLCTDLNYYQDQLSDIETELILLNKYKASIEDNVNYFENNSEEEEYYLKFQQYFINYEITKKEYIYSDEERELNLNSVTEQLNISQEKLSNMETLKESINWSKNLFSKTDEELEYYNLYLKYKSDYKTIVKQYDNAKTEIDLSTTKEGLINSLDYYNDMLKGLEFLYQSVEKGKNLFDTTSSYSLQYEEYINRTEELTTAYEQAKENYEINKALEGLAVTEWDVQLSKDSMDDAKRALDLYKVSFLEDISANIMEVNKNIEELKLAKDNTLSKDDLYKQNEQDKNNAIENFELKYITELDVAINTLKENIATLEVNKSTLELQGEKVFLLKDQNNQHGNLIEFKNTELNTTISSINTYTDKKSELEANIDKINMQIDSAVVKATKSGVINSNVELVEGDVLSNGVEVLTIIPEDNSKYKVSIYVSNEDIGKLREGMAIKFNVYALPNSEYGYLTGKVTKISKDLKVDSDNIAGYYLIEADLDEKALYDAQGNKAELKSGMACQAQMIVESKKIITYVLEKIDLW